MLKKLFFTATFLILFNANVQAQRFSEKGWGLVNLEKHQVKFNLVSPGLSYEIGLFKNTTASTSFGLGLATYEEGYSFGFAWHTRLRYYTNLKRRLNLNKNVAGNSGDYIAPARSVFWGPGDGVPNGYGPFFNFTFGWTPKKRKPKKVILNQK